MDQLSAHLDRGWDLVSRGDTRGAELSARRALELDKEAPEAYNLLGYVAALHGEFEEAIEHYQQAIALDDTYLEAMLNAAEVLIHPLGELEEAERLCDDALELAESDDERVDALLLKFDALLGQEQVAAAKALCDRFGPGPFNNPAHTFLVGRALYEIGELQKAAPLIELATQTSPTSAESFYYLGLLRDEQGEAALATSAFLKSRELEVESPRAPWALSTDKLHELTLQAMSNLPAELKDRISAANTFIADLPGVEVIVEGVDPRALLLLDAPAFPTPSETGASGASPAPSSGPGSAKEPVPQARLFVYQRNIERTATEPETIVAELTVALQRELSQAFLGSDGSD
jgi:tetratricopeptide (TPR) repeat protein